MSTVSGASAGSDTKRGASKWCCPTGKCTPRSVWVKADRLHTLIPRTIDKWKAIYRTRTAVEREFGSLKHEWGMLPLRVRRLPRVRLHVELTILARLASALTEARAVPLAGRLPRARQRRAIRHAHTTKTGRKPPLTPANRVSPGQLRAKRQVKAGSGAPG
ncbi:MAG: transposase [Pseudonocardiaceae bacterium]